MFDPTRARFRYILAGDYESLDRLYNDRDRLVTVLKQIAHETVNGQQSLAASCAKGALKED
jgi:hypothetical protein